LRQNGKKDRAHQMLLPQKTKKFFKTKRPPQGMKVCCRDELRTDNNFFEQQSGRARKQGKVRVGEEEIEVTNVHFDRLPIHIFLLQVNLVDLSCHD
jgi:hypothetical protein